MPIVVKNTAYKKLKLTNINFFIILFISLSFLKYIYNQDKISQLAPIKCRSDTSERNLGDIDADPYNILSCTSYLSINNHKCFNNILRFNQKNYQLNSISSNKNGDFLIQYNEYINYNELTYSRFFYGLTNNGQYFFSNKSSFSNELNIDIDEHTLYGSYTLNLYGIQDSKNSFVSIRDDINKKINIYLA